MRNHGIVGRKRRGSAMLEFVIAGIAGATLMVSTFQMSLVMWNYHTLAYAVHETNRYIASHGRSCTQGGNTCTITVGNIANKLKSYAVGIPDTSLKMTLTSQSGTVYTCNTVSACENDTTQWPPVAYFDNMPGNYTTIRGSLLLHPALIQLWFGMRGQTINTVKLPASSSIPIMF